MPIDDFLGGDLAGGNDPLTFLRSLFGDNALESTKTQAIKPLPGNVIPAKPLPTPMSDAVHPQGGADWKALLEQIGPLLGSFAMHNPSARTGFLNGYMEGQQLGKAERDKKSAAQQAKNQAAANYRLQVGQHAMEIADPVQRAQFIDLAESSGATAGLLKAGDLADLRAVPASQASAARLKELADQLASLEKSGYNLGDLANGGSHVRLKDGTEVPITTALQLTNVQPFDTGGAPVAKPAKDKRGFSKIDVLMKGETTPREINYDPDTGKYSDPDTGAAILSTAFTKYSKPATIDPGSVAAQYNDLVDLWKAANPGKEPPASVRTKLRADANKVNDKPAAAVGGVAGGLTDDGLEYAATQYRVTGTMPPLGMASKEARTAVVNRAAQQAKDLKQSPAVAIQRQSAYKSDATALTRMRAMSSAAEAFETKALQQADIVESLSNKVGRTQYPLINDALLAGKARILGDANTQLLYNALATFTTEYAKIMEGSTGSAAGSTESARAAASHLISAGLSKGTLSQTLALMKREMALTIQGYDATIDHITSRMGGASPAPVAAPPPASSTPSYADYLKAKKGAAVN